MVDSFSGDAYVPNSLDESTQDATEESPPGAILGALLDVFARPVVEFGSLITHPVFWGLGVPRGDGHPVMVLPGLGGSDGYLQLLRDWLWRIGYRPIPSGMGRNRGWSEEIVRALGDRAERLFERTGRRVTIIGHSLGGLQARSVAIRRPHVVRHVITMGSPLFRTRGQVPSRVRITSLYSLTDQIVPPPFAMARDEGSIKREVAGSHVGLAFNPIVYRELGELLRTMPV